MQCTRRSGQKEDKSPAELYVFEYTTTCCCGRTLQSYYSVSFLTGKMLCPWYLCLKSQFYIPRDHNVPLHQTFLRFRRTPTASAKRHGSLETDSVTSFFLLVSILKCITLLLTDTITNESWTRWTYTNNQPTTKSTEPTIALALITWSRFKPTVENSMWTQYKTIAGLICSLQSPGADCRITNNVDLLSKI